MVVQSLPIYIQVGGNSVKAIFNITGKDVELKNLKFGR